MTSFLHRLLAAALLATLAGIAPATAQSLVAEFTFSNPSNLGLDSSGNGNNATTVLNVTQGTGPTAGVTSGVFNQTSEFWILNGLAGYTGIPGFTFSAWVDVSGAYTGYNGIISQDFGGCCINRLLLSGGTNPFVNAGAHNDVQLNVSEPKNTWYNIVMTSADTAGGNTTDVYVNGTLIAGTPISYGNTIPNLATARTYIGAGENGGPYRLSGALADVRIYQGALSDSQVTALYQAGAGGTATAAPEPASMALLGAALAGLGLARRRRT